MKWIAGRMAWIGLGLSALGCGGGSAPELRPEAFVATHPGMEPGVMSKPVDQAGTLVYGDLHAPLLPEEYPNRNPKLPTAISPQVRRAIPTSNPTESAALPPAATTLPTTRPGQPLPNTYEVVGTVVEIVNGTPIYADKVVSSIQATLSADARRMDANQFRQDAAQKILERVEALRFNYLEVAAASEALSPEDKQQADMYASVIRSQLIAAAGGSAELAKQQALDEHGQTLDEEVKERRDATLVQLYYQRFVVPKIQVSADDMRAYYQQNLATKFSHAAAARFRLIKVDVDRSGGPERALEKAKEIVRQLKGGADFAKLASQYNDIPSLMPTGGDVGWIDKGSYRVDEVEKAVWNLHPGEFTDPPIEVRAPDAAFYVAKLEAIKPGAVQPFDSDEVQDTIRNTLFDAQFHALREKRLLALERQAVTFQVPQGMDAAVDIAMQRYPAWAAAK